MMTPKQHEMATSSKDHATYVGRGDNILRLTMKYLILLACLMPAVCSAQEVLPRPFNVLFIAVDDLRPELGCYGNHIVKTPNIDRLAARGIVFDRAYCQQAVCSPSRTAIMTGLRPDVTKVWDLETHFRAARPDCVTLPQYFKAHGYHCSALGKIYHNGFEDGRSWNEPHWYPKGRAVDTDPDDWKKQIITKHNINVEEFANPLQDGPKNAKGRTKKGPAFEVSPKSDDELPDGATAAEAVKRIHRLTSQSQPFFLAVGFLKPHLPFVAPKQYWDLYDPDQIPVPTIDHLPTGAPEFAGHTNGELHSYPGVPTENPIPADFARKLRHGYYACTSYTDAQVGRLLDALEQTEVLDNTIIVLWGDHGWQLGDHGLWHKHTNFEIAARAPLLISVPKSKTAGKTCAAPVEFVDVYPTLADLCGLPQPSGLAGLSLKPYIDDPAAPMQKVAISQYPRSAGAGAGQVMGYSIRDERWRATFWRERTGSRIVATELYDEQHDPAETVSLADKPEHQELLANLAKHLPPVGSAAPIPKPAPQPKATPSTSPAGETRTARFSRLYPGKEQLTVAEYIAAQGKDVAAAKQRFAKMDKNNDGILTRAEFIGESNSKDK